MDKPVTNEEKKLALNQSIYWLTKEQAFYGNLLQELNVRYMPGLGTLAIAYNDKIDQFEIYLDPEYFCRALNHDLRVSGFHHEVLHFTNKHLFRLPWVEASPEQRKIMNIAGDMAINQVPFLKTIAKGCDKCKGVKIEDYEHYQALHEGKKNSCPGTWVDYQDWKMDDGSTFPSGQNLETYYDLINKEREKQEKNGKKSKGNVPEKLKGHIPFDAHDWEKLDEATKAKMLAEAKKLVRRTIEKTSQSHSNVPESIKDLLQELEGLSSGINHKQILRNIIKKTVSAADRESTWNRPNKRYGAVAQGTRIGNLPKCAFYVDTSGSISHTELNVFLRIMDGFLKVGVRTCSLALWHTSMYLKRPYRWRQEVDKSDVESGGTDVSCVLEDIKKTNPNLAIILTDGYYDASNIKIASEVLWIISKGGNQNHPMKHIGKTILLENIK